MSDTRTAILSSGAPPPPPFLSQAIRDGNLVFCSGQIGVDLATDELVSGTVQDRTVRHAQTPRQTIYANLYSAKSLRIYLRSLKVPAPALTW